MMALKKKETCAPYSCIHEINLLSGRVSRFNTTASVMQERRVTKLASQLESGSLNDNGISV